MPNRKFKFHDGESGAALAVRVKHSSQGSGFVNVLRDGTVVIQLDKKAGGDNEKLVKFISQALKIPKKRIQIIAGQDGDNKLISIVDMPAGIIQEKILELLP